MMARGKHRTVCDPHGSRARGTDLRSGRKPEWESFWDVASPVTAARALRELFGPDAVRAANSCIVSSAADNRDADQRFWTAVADELRVIHLPVCTNRWQWRRYVIGRSRAGRNRGAGRPAPYPYAPTSRPRTAPHRGKSML